VNGTKLVRLFAAKDEAEVKEVKETRLEKQPEQVDRSGESAGDESGKKERQVLTWGSIRLNDSRIAQPWHERLRQIRGDQDRNF